MRISDWSSDVCSSDLREQLDELLRDNTRSHLRALRDELLGASAPAPLVDRIVELHGLDGTIGVANLAARMGREGSEVALAKAYTIIGEALGVDWAKGAALRSEEHTSELQSLMRISYAVFCLKKKNKQDR